MVIGDGAVLHGATLRNAVVGECVYVGDGSVVEDALLLGNSQWLSHTLREAAIKDGERVYGVGEPSCLPAACWLPACLVPAAREGWGGAAASAAPGGKCLCGTTLALGLLPC